METPDRSVGGVAGGMRGGHGRGMLGPVGQGGGGPQGLDRGMDIDGHDMVPGGAGGSNFIGRDPSVGMRGRADHGLRGRGGGDIGGQADAMRGGYVDRAGSWGGESAGEQKKTKRFFRASINSLVMVIWF